MEKWADFIRYDENKNHFSFGGKGNWRDEYEVHSLTKSLKHINESYDESGFLAVQSIKQFFFKTLKELNVCLFDLFSDDKEYKKELAEYKDMYRLLTSPKIKGSFPSYFWYKFSMVNRCFSVAWTSTGVFCAFAFTSMIRSRL